MNEIKTAAGLDALPVGSVAVGKGMAWLSQGRSWISGEGIRGGAEFVAREFGPLTVLYRPDAVPVSVLPIVEAVAREIDPESWRYYDTGILPPTHPGALAVVRKSKEAAERVLKLFPGRTEAEVKAEALEEAAERLSDKWAQQADDAPRSTLQIITWLFDRAAAIRAGESR